MHTVRRTRHAGLGVMTGVFGFIPVVGPLLAFGSWATAGIYVITDESKDTVIHNKVKEFTRRHVELKKMFPYL